MLSHRCGGVTTYGETKGERTEVNDGTAQLYPDVEAVQCQGKNIVYLRPQAAGIPLRHLLHKGRYDLLERSGEGVSGRIQTLRDRAIKQLMHGELPKLEKQLAETTGLFRGKERKALQEKISGVQQEIDRRMDLLPGILKEDGYPDVQAFKRTYDDATALVEQYNRDLAAWERQVHGGQQPQQKPPEKESIRKKLRDMEAEAKRRNDARRQQTRPRSHDYDRGR